MEEPQTVEFSRLLEFNNLGRGYLQANPKERSTVTFALNKLLKHYENPIKRTQNEYQEKVNEGAEDIRVKYCEKDSNGAFKEQSYGEGEKLVLRKVFTGDNERKANKEIKALNKTIEDECLKHQVELTKVHIVDVPPQIDIMFIEAFKGFIFAPMTEEQIEAHYMAQNQKKEPAPAGPQNGVTV